MKFLNDLTFYEKFSKIEDIKYYPYVGLNFNNEQKKILIFAHNIYCDPKKFETELERTKSPTHFSDALAEYAYVQAKWTTAFRNFIKGSLAINENYSKSSSIETMDKINNFISKVSFTNYINDLVKSERANNVDVPNELVKKSHTINQELISILKVTHIVCWGNQVFDYILKKASNIEMKSFNDIENLSPSRGFGYAKIDLNGRRVHLLKVHHPSMPYFGHKNINTQNILKWFYELN